LAKPQHQSEKLFMSKKVLFVATVVKNHIMQFHIPYLKMFKDMGWETAVASRNDHEDPADCVIPYCDTFYDVPFERNPLKPGNFKAYKELKKAISEGDFDIIHCHTPVGGMLGRLAAVKARQQGAKVMYTAHGFHFFKGAPLLNWLVYYPVERFMARFTDVLITINKEDYARAQKFKAKKVCYVPGVGIDTDRFKCSADEKTAKREEILTRYGIPVDATVLLSVGEFTKNKNHKMAIEAISKLNRDDVYYIICGRGELQEECEEYAKALGLSSRVIFAGYRNDVQDYYKAADLFLFPSFREGLPVAVMEALASGLPVVCTNIRGSADLVEDGINGFVTEISPEAFYRAIKIMLSKENSMFFELKENVDQFDLKCVVSQMKDIYLN